MEVFYLFCQHISYLHRDAWGNSRFTRLHLSQALEDHSFSDLLGRNFWKCTLIPTEFHGQASVMLNPCFHSIRVIKAELSAHPGRFKLAFLHRHPGFDVASVWPDNSGPLWSMLAYSDLLCSCLASQTFWLELFLKLALASLQASLKRFCFLIYFIAFPFLTNSFDWPYHSRTRLPTSIDDSSSINPLMTALCRQQQVHSHLSLKNRSQILQHILVLWVSTVWEK